MNSNKNLCTKFSSFYKQKPFFRLIYHRIGKVSLTEKIRRIKVEWKDHFILFISWLVLKFKLIKKSRLVNRLKTQKSFFYGARKFPSKCTRGGKTPVNANHISIYFPSIMLITYEFITVSFTLVESIVGISIHTPAVLVRE